MALDRAREWIMQYYRQSRIRRAIKIIVIVLLGVAWVFSEFFSLLISLEQTLLMLVVVIVISLELVETTVYNVDRAIDRPITTFSDHVDADDEVDEYIESTDPSNAYIIAYSASTNPSQSAIGELMRNDCNIRILIKHPNESKGQESRYIANALENLYEFDPSYDDIEIQFYREDASVKATKIDDFLLVSWYTFAGLGPREVRGYDNPAVRLTAKAGDDYSNLDAWYTELFAAIWKKSTSPWALYQSEDCPSELERWLEEQGRQEHQQSRREWLKRISPSDEGRQRRIFPKTRRAQMKSE